MADATPATGPDLKNGIREVDLADGAMLAGHVDGEAVLLARQGDEVFAIGATCTHYGGPLGEGLMVGDTVRCPWHHACFSLRTGEALAAPALNPTSCWRVERRDGRIHVHEKVTATDRPAGSPAQPAGGAAARMVIIGGGAAGYAAAQMLRRKGFAGSVVIVSADDAAPYDRPNLSKDYLAGEAPEEWIPLAGKEYYAANEIDLRLGVAATAIDPSNRLVALDNGTSLNYTKLLIATGAEPIRLKVPGADLPHVQTLRSLADSRRIIARAKARGRAVIVGASFIGLEAAAALRHRGVEVHVVAPEARPMERVFGPALGDFIRELHESHGVKFHLGHTVKEIDGQRARLDDETTIDADLVLIGIGVRPRIALAEQAGLSIERGVLVDEYLQTSAGDIFAAGDIARWPDPYTGERLRVEHWVVAERQGQTAARNMLGSREPYRTVPFFWSQQYDVAIDYIGHAVSWDRIEQNGDLASRDVALRFYRGGRTLAFAAISRGRESLLAELAMEQGRSP
jgi:NADPH-dependent 2,4-dienoyl-CoA reductase/sulfur reductase-like enzyme/nitrite reductase/ring-hydroxylating ferredoxin subunit